MSDETLFRTPTTPTEIKPSQNPSTQPTESVTTPTDSKPNPAELIALGKPPYLAELLEMGKLYNTFGLPEQSLEVDRFIQSEIDRRGMELSRENYDKVLKSIWDKIEHTDSVYKNTERLRDYARMQTKLLDALKEKEEFEKKDPMEMTASELRRFINASK